VKREGGQSGVIRLFYCKKESSGERWYWSKRKLTQWKEGE